MLLNVTVPGQIVRLTVFTDAVKLEIEEYARPRIVGWFRDEVSAVCAACERGMMRSAILPELRRLPEIQVHCEYRLSKSDHETHKFVRGTALKAGPLGRRLVLTPGAHSKPWLA